MGWFVAQSQKQKETIAFCSTIRLLSRHATGQGRIYIGASRSMAPGPEVPGGPFEGTNKHWEAYFIKFEGAPGTD